MLNSPSIKKKVEKEEEKEEESVVSMADSHNENNGNARHNRSPREQDRYLPIANVSRIMKRSLPADAKISKAAKEKVQECASEFLSFVTGEASDKCKREKRKTINGDDLLCAMSTLGFDEFVVPLKVYLQRFREMEGEKGGGSGSQSQKDGVTGGGGGDGGVGGGMSMGNNVAGLFGPSGMVIGMGQPIYGGAQWMPPSCQQQEYQYQQQQQQRYQQQQQQRYQKQLQEQRKQPQKGRKITAFSPLFNTSDPKA